MSLSRSAFLWCSAVAVAVAVCGSAHARVSRATVGERTAFPRPPGLESRIEFWKLIFTHYSARQVVIHDAQYVEKVYSVLDLGGAGKRRGTRAINAEKARVRAILLRLDGRGVDRSEGLGGEELRIFELFRDVNDRRRFRTAADRLRAQAGLREQFEDAVRVARRYLPRMEEIFEAEGLPAELTRLPFIESCFNVKAYSWRGAAGIWQFMPRTGRLHGLRIDRVVDERRDPLRATRAAARYLRGAYEALGTWPLAITSYNHGVKGIAKGVRTVGSRDIEALVTRYDGRGFGFAGRNFYVEFLAAVEIERETERYFGPIEIEPLPHTEELLLVRSLGLTEVARAAGVSREELVSHNPALGSQVVRGRARVPRGYRVRLPAESRAEFEGQMAKLKAAPAEEPPADAPGVHRVRRGETLWDIARRYGTSVEALLDANEIADARRVMPGRRLRIPEREGTPRLAASARGGGDGDAAAVVVARADRGARAHRVRRGQTLSHIARRYGTSVEALLAHNGIPDARKVRAGQVVRIPTGNGDGHVHDAVATVSLESSAARSVAVPAIDSMASDGGSSGGDASDAVSVPGMVAAKGHGDDVDPGYINHRVRRGQTLSHIARKYGTSVGVLKRYNGIRDARRVRAGQMIKVPRRSPQGDPEDATAEQGSRDGWVWQSGTRGPMLATCRGHCAL